MKYPFRFTDAYIADLDQIVSARILPNPETSILIIFKTIEDAIVCFDTVEECTQKFEDFSRACADYALQQQLKGK